jgi:putative copper export protein
LFLVRLLLFLALAAIGVSGLLYLYSRDRKYLKFIGQVIKFTIILGVVVFAFFAFERIVGPSL